MRSLELIRTLNEDPALRSEHGITARRLAARIQTLIEMGKLEHDAVLHFGPTLVIAVGPNDEGDRLYLELDEPTPRDVLEGELYSLRAAIDAAERVVEAWGRISADDAGAVDFDDLAESAIAEMDALREALADVKRQAAIVEVGGL